LLLEWVVTFTSNPGFTPTGSGDVNRLVVVTSLLPARRPRHPARQAPLAGYFTLDFADPLQVIPRPTRNARAPWAARPTPAKWLRAREPVMPLNEVQQIVVGAPAASVANRARVVGPLQACASPTTERAPSSRAPSAAGSASASRGTARCHPRTAPLSPLWHGSEKWPRAGSAARRTRLLSATLGFSTDGRTSAAPGQRRGRHFAPSLPPSLLRLAKKC
jgi:hypothetical protein